MKHYQQLDNPTQEQLDTLLAEGWEFYSEQTQFVVSQNWYAQYAGNTMVSIRGSDSVARHWLVTLIKVGAS